MCALTFISCFGMEQTSCSLNDDKIILISALRIPDYNSLLLEWFRDDMLGQFRHQIYTLRINIINRMSGIQNCYIHELLCDEKPSL